MFAHQPQSFSSIRCGQDAVTFVCQNFTKQTADIVFIIHYQNCFHASRRMGARFLHCAAFRATVASRKQDVESCSVSRLAIHADVTACLVNDAIYGCEPEPGTFALFFRSKEW